MDIDAAADAASVPCDTYGCRDFDTAADIALAEAPLRISGDMASSMLRVISLETSGDTLAAWALTAADTMAAEGTAGDGAGLMADGLLATVYCVASATGVNPSIADLSDGEMLADKVAGTAIETDGTPVTVASGIKDHVLHCAGLLLYACSSSSGV